MGISNQQYAAYPSFLATVAAKELLELAIPQLPLKGVKKIVH